MLPWTSVKSTMRWRIALCGLVLLAIIAIGTSPARHSLLRAAGEMLVMNDGMERVDVIVLAVDADGAGVLEAADLVRGGIATRVAIFSDPPDAVDREFLRRGVPYSDAAAESAGQLHALGVSSVERIPSSVAGTEDEGPALARWNAQNGLNTIMFVCLADHSRRTHRVMARAMRGKRAKIIIRYSRYSDFDPETWWRTRNGIRTEIEESQKLLLDLLQHPFS